MCGADGDLNRCATLQLDRVYVSDFRTGVSSNTHPTPCYFWIAYEVSSTPFSLTPTKGYPRISAIRSNSRVTRSPESDVLTTAAKHSLLKSLITLRRRGQRPKDRMSNSKHSNHRWFSPCGIVIGASVRTASLHARSRPVYGLLIPLPVSSGIASFYSRASLRDTAGDAAVDIRSAAALTTILSTDPADQYLLISWMSGDKHADHSQLSRRRAPG